MDYTDLNEACPKESFPLPRIDQIVDASTEHGMLPFLYAFSDNHQIPMHPPYTKKSIDKDVVQFVWKNIVCRFGIPQSIVSDNGPQFDSIVYRTFCNELKIKNLYSTPRYPQSNGQAESSNKTLLTALKKRLHSVKGKLVDKLPRVLWAYTTTSQKPIGMPPFTLTYRMEAIIPSNWNS